MYNRFRYGDTFVKGSSVAQQVQDPSAPIDPNFDPMYNRFRYGDTFVKGSSVAQQVQDPSAPIDPNFDPMYNRFRYGDTFVKGSSVAQTEPLIPVNVLDPTLGGPGSRGAHMQVRQVQDPSAPVDPNFDPMYNRFRYGDTFVKGSSVAQ